MSRFVSPQPITLSLSKGDTITVRKRLNYGEQRAMFARMYIAGVDGDLKTNPMGIGLSTVLAYLLDWSFVDDQGKKVVIKEKPIEHVLAVLDALDPESFTEIRTAIEQHEIAIEKEREAEKNAQDGEKTAPAISPSPSGAAGASSGSASST